VLHLELFLHLPAGSELARIAAASSVMSIPTGRCNVRNSARSRYRQWMTHKLAHWIDQFGTSGCVGCGRCAGA
jgi:hypothetical protein